MTSTIFEDVVGGRHMIIESNPGGWSFDTTGWPGRSMLRADGTQGITRSTAGVYIPFATGWSVEYLVNQVAIDPTLEELFVIGSVVDSKQILELRSPADQAIGFVRVSGSIIAGWNAPNGRHHLAAVMRSTNVLALYLDGVAKNWSSTAGPTPVNSNYRNYMGRWQDGVSYVMSTTSSAGRLAFYNRELTGAEIKRRAVAALLEL